MARGAILVAHSSNDGLAAAVVSITPTQRRRFFWAVWWTGAPSRRPFRKPDASNGGAKSFEEALRAAELAANRHLVVIEPLWARAWNRVLRGQPPFTEREVAAQSRPRVPVKDREPTKRASAWSILGVEEGATADEVKRAYRKRALEVHPDRGGDAEVFRSVQRAYERLTQRLAKEGRRRR